MSSKLPTRNSPRIPSPRSRSFPVSRVHASRLRPSARWVVVLVGLATALGLGVLSQLPSEGGPLAEAGSNTTGWHLPEGRTAAWAMVLSETTTEIELRWIKPDGIVGLEVLGIVVSRVPFANFNETVSPVFSTVWPPVTRSLIDPGEPAGAIQPASDLHDYVLQVLVGVRLLPGATEGSIKQLRIGYLSGGTLYESVLHRSLVLRPPGAPTFEP